MVVQSMEDLFLRTHHNDQDTLDAIVALAIYFATTVCLLPCLNGFICAH